MRVVPVLAVLLVVASMLGGMPGDAEAARDHAGLPNVVTYGGSSGIGFYSGGAPEGDEGFESLRALGIKTIVSVDGALPDLARAKARGMRYVHLPIGYDGFDDARKAELVRAVRDLPKPIYLHCHHGKHRSAGAAATVAVSLGWMRNAEAAARMKVSGTAEGYKGLWACAAKASVMQAREIDAAPAEFPEVTRPGTVVAAMVAADEALERLRSVERNGWRAPAEHPDLAPAADAAAIAEVFRLLDAAGHLDSLCDDARADFRALLAANATQAGALEGLLAAGSTDAERLGVAMKDLAAGCKACHLRHRDARLPAAPSAAPDRGATGAARRPLD